MIYSWFLTGIDFEANPQVAIFIGVVAVGIANLDIVRKFLGK